MITRCSACTGENNLVPPDGPLNSEILFIGEAPGFDENKKMVPFIGKTGREVNEHYLPLCGLRRETVRFDNAISCLPSRPKGKVDLNDARDLELVQTCAEHHLYPEIQKMRPKVIVPMGAFACYALDPSIDLEIQHGIPVETIWGTVFPMFHPAGGLHEPKKMLHIRTDWDRLRKYLRGNLRIPVDDYAGTEDYRVIEKPGDIQLSGVRHLPLACDTEVKRSSRRDPFCLTYSVQPGTGFLIQAGDSNSLSTFQDHLDKWEGPILWHNWLFDCEVVREMGLRFPHRNVRDTMVLCFHLGNLPQGLKALCYRLLGMKMQDFTDLVTPYSTPVCLEYLREAYDVDWPKPDPEFKRDKTGKWKVYKPQGMKTKLKRFMTDYMKSPATKDVFKSWENWESSQDMIEKECGPWPGRCITHVPFEKSLFYACRDADGLVRLWPVLQRMLKRVRKTTQENWLAA